MNKKFQVKLLLAFVFLVLIIIIPTVFLVNSNINTLSEGRIDANLKLSKEVFKNFLDSRLKSSSQAAKALLATQPSLRAVLGSSQQSEDDLFGDETQKKGPAKETGEILFASVESFELYQSHPVFLFTDAQGRIVFSKANSQHSNINIQNISVLQSAYEGRESMSFWGSADEELAKYPILPASKENILYEVFAQPLVFGTSNVKGVMVVGYPISTQTIREIKEITQTEIAFVSQGKLYGTSLLNDFDFTKLVENKTDDEIIRFESGGEKFIGSVSLLKDNSNRPVASAIIFRSKTKELAFYQSIKNALNISALVATLLAVLLSFFISGNVTRAIKILVKAVNEVRKGNLDLNVSVPTQDEFSDLAAAINNMTKGLKEKESIKKTFKRYVNPRVVNALLEDENKSKLGGDKRELVIFFSDVAGFTKISEALTPEATIEFLNEYLSKVTKVIEGSDGIVDKYIGDAVMAYWISPTSLKENATMACRSATKQQKVIRDLKTQWKDNAILNQFDVRIGIHAGEVVIGNVGSDERMDYTIIGDNVNTAARLESINKLYGTSILVTEPVAECTADEFLFREVDLIQVVGKSKPVKIFELIGDLHEVTAAEKEKQKQFSEAMSAYKSGQFSAASQIFRSILKVYPTDLPSDVFLKRCELLINDPPLDWNGVYQAKFK